MSAFSRPTQVLASRAATLSRQLGGSGTPNLQGWYSCRCPAHADRVASLSLKDTAWRGRLLVKCWGPCSTADIAAKLDAMVAGGALSPLAAPPPPSTTEPADPGAGARRIWGDTTALSGTLGEWYLRRRGITTTLPATLRFHPRLYHKDSNSHHPALVAAVQRADGEQVAIHRTWLASRGHGKADVAPNKMCLGPVSGSAVRLGEGGDVLVVAEGIETALSIAQLYGAPAWAALGTSGLHSIVVPPEYTSIVIAADHDPVGLAAANALRRRLLLLHDRKVRVIKPQIEGQDFNDVLLARGEMAA